MRKISVIILSALLLTLILCVPVSAAAMKEYPILKAGTTPSLDGVVNPDEWQNAKVGYVDKTVPSDGTKWGDLEDEIKGDFYALWSDEGIYLAASIYDDKNGLGVCPADDVFGRGDGVQFLIDPAFRRESIMPQDASNCYIFDMFPESPSWYEHFIYGDDKIGYVPMPENTGIVISGSTGTEKWSVEAFIPWNAMKFDGEPFTVAEGMKMSLAYIIMDYDSDRVMVSGFCSMDTWNTEDYDIGVLSTTLGGIVPAAETEAPAETNAPSEGTTAPPSVTAPQTNDPVTAVILLASTICAGGLFTLNRKRK